MKTNRNLDLNLIKDEENSH